jgi:hypothetical protein
MDPVAMMSIAIELISIGLDIGDIGARAVASSIPLIRLYGPRGLLLFVFGDRTAWRTQAAVLGNLEDEEAMAFKKSVQNECSMVSIAVRACARKTSLITSY